MTTSPWWVWYSIHNSIYNAVTGEMIVKRSEELCGEEVLNPDSGGGGDLGRPAGVPIIEWRRPIFVFVVVIGSGVTARCRLARLGKAVLGCFDVNNV